MAGQFPLPLGFHVEKADHGEDHRTDEVDQQVAHGINEANIQIAAHPKGGLGAVGVNQNHICNVLHMNRDIPPLRMEGHRMNGLHNGILLHILSHKAVHAPLKKLPQHANGHGKAKGHDRHVKGGQTQHHPLVPVQDIDQREAHGGKEEAIEGVQNVVPERDNHIILLDFAQNFSGVNKEKYDNLQGVRQVNVEPPFNERGNGKENQGQNAGVNVFKIAIERLGHQRPHHRQPQQHRHRHHQLFILDMAVLNVKPVPGFLIFFHGVPPKQLKAKLIQKLDQKRQNQRDHRNEPGIEHLPGSSHENEAEASHQKRAKHSLLPAHQQRKGPFRGQKQAHTLRQNRSIPARQNNGRDNHRNCQKYLPKAKNKLPRRAQKRPNGPHRLHGQILQFL